jgi:hypothetical protein
VSTEVNFDSRFGQDLPNADMRRVIRELQELRDSYLRYMAATAEAITEIFLKGSVWARYTSPSWLKGALKPFANP